MGGRDGMVLTCQTRAMTAMGTIQKKAPRQPIIEPKKLPNGAAIVVAKALPPFKSPNAFGTSLNRTSRITIAVDIDQKPPITTPKIARPNIKKWSCGQK